jgi:hypothetical protein
MILRNFHFHKPMKKLQPPSSNIQRSTKLQAPSHELQARIARGGFRLFEHWCLKFLWSLEVGIWCFLVSFKTPENS